MMGMDGGRRLFERETLKPKDLSVTLRRFGSYFRRHWTGALLAILLVTGQAWTQVVTPELIGQAVDCYLFPRDPGTCWFSAITLDMEQDIRIQGLGKLVLALLGLNLAGSLAGGHGLLRHVMDWPACLASAAPGSVPPDPPTLHGLLRPQRNRRHHESRHQ